MSKREMTAKQAGTEVATEMKKDQVAVAKKEKRTISPPPAPPVKLGDTPNPLIAKRGLKRAMVVAIAKICTHTKDGKHVIDVVKAVNMIRTSGILYKAGYTDEAKTNPLIQSEWSGYPYLRFVTNTPVGKVYEEKHPEKIKECLPFVKALKKAVDDILAETEKKPEPEVAAAPVAVTA